MANYYFQSLFYYAKSKDLVNGESIDNFLINKDLRLETSLKLNNLANTHEQKKWAIEFALGKYVNGEFNNEFQDYNNGNLNIIEFYNKLGFNKNKIKKFLKKIKKINS